MNSDLAFCLERFFDDQILLIDAYLEKVKEKKAAEYERIEEMRSAAIARRKLSANQRPHREDAMIVTRFIHNLIEIAGSDDSACLTEVQRYREMMCTEFSAKIDDCSNHVMRLRNLAKPRFRSAGFVTQCNKAIKYLQQGQVMTENYDKLHQIIEESNQMNVADRVQRWWDEAYGSAIMKIIQLNKAYNPGVGNQDIAFVPPWSQPIDCARKILSIGSPKMTVYGKRKDFFVRTFVQQIRSIDPVTREEISENDLIYQLKAGDIEFAKDFTENWLRRRDEIRNQKEEDTFDLLWQEAKHRFDRQCIAQESKKVVLACLLRRLAIGVDDIEPFDQRLKITLFNQRENKGVPAITGNIGEPILEKLPITIHLEQVSMSQWARNINKIRDKFITALCQAFRIPNGTIRVLKVEVGSVLIRAYVEPPYGNKIIESLNGTALDSPARVKAVHECCLSVKGSVQSITLGKFSLSVDRKLMNPSWNRKYLWWKSDTENGEYWEKQIDPGAKPYICPSGWFRFGLKVADSKKEFEARWGKWHVVYHATKSKHAIDILTAALHMNTTGYYYDNCIPEIHVSPSIEYCAHTNFAEPWMKTEENGKTRWFQVVLQCRVNPAAVKTIKPETLLSQNSKKKVTIDPNFLNKELEWVITGKEDAYHMSQDIICCGLMMHVSDVDPVQLPTSEWWKYVSK